MPEKYWHADTVDEIVTVADEYLWSNTQGPAEKAHEAMKKLGKTRAFLTRVAILHLERRHQTVREPNFSDVAQDMQEWIRSEDAYRTRWFSPMVRGSAGPLTSDAAYAVGVGANSVLRHAEETLEQPFAAEDGILTYLRPEELLEEVRKLNS